MMPNALPIYAMGRLLWDADARPGDVAEEYFEGLYGDDAARVRTYFEAVSALCDTDYANANGPRLRPDLTGRYREMARLSRMESETLEDGGNPILRRYGSTLLQNAAYADALAALTAGDEAAAMAACDRWCRIIREREAVYPMDFDVYRAIEVTQRYTGLKETPCNPTNDKPTTERDESV